MNLFPKKINKGKELSKELSKETIEDRKRFYNMLLKIEQKRPVFNAKRVMKKLFPDYFLV